MVGRYDQNPFDEEDEVNPFSDGRARGKTSGESKFTGGAFYTSTTGSVPAVTNSGLSPHPPEPADFNNPTTSVDIPLDSTLDLKKKERELQGKETELKRREQDLKKKERELQGKDTELKRREQDLKKKERELQVKETELKRREQDLKKKERELLGKETELKRREQVLKKKERDLQGKETELKRREQDLKRMKESCRLKKLY